MTITIQIDGLEQVAAKLRRFGADAETAVANAVTATALEVNRAVKKAIQRGPKTGRVYRRGKGSNLSRTHTASAPGQAPATDSGFLASSIYFEQDSQMQATIGSRLAYAYYLEYGTSQIDPRPVWQPETEKGQVALMERINKALKRAAK